MRIGILTLSDRAARGEYSDESGRVVREIVEKNFAGAEIIAAIIPDDLPRIKRTLKNWCDKKKLDLILTTGGTGFAPRDVTPEATRAVIEKEASGLVYAMIAASLQKTPYAMLTRMVAGIRGKTLIINLPGSPIGARENLETILPALPHALELLNEQPTQH
ncbi:MAG: MogA/MoaB family molybdenum cofactor biosynthesis protein [Chloroflexi bacterium]|nr:MogA/MoaB family molybdenum cofactor biosynthesis protein [Chloroflexota bacterium]